MNQQKPQRSHRRQSKGAAWHWQQTDGWYYTPPGTKKRVPLLDGHGRRIRGRDKKQAAELALARLKVDGKWRPSVLPTANEEWLVARVCSDYLHYCERGVANDTMSAHRRTVSVLYLNDLCGYCGALPVSQLTKEHIRHWLDSHPSWRSPATIGGIIGIVLAAFNRATNMHDVPNPLTGLKKPPAPPRLLSFAPEDEQALYAAVIEPFRQFLFAAIHTGLRPFSELARLTAAEVIETERGMMWRVYASKTGKTRKVPVRAEVAELTRELLKTASPGSGVPLFRSPNGKRWQPYVAGARLRRIRRRLGWDQDAVRQQYTCYTCRHTFAHRMLSGYWNGGAGCSIETLAELMGDTPQVAFAHYGMEWGQHYQEPLWAAIGLGQQPTACAGHDGDTQESRRSPRRRSR